MLRNRNIVIGLFLVLLTGSRFLAFAGDGVSAINRSLYRGVSGNDVRTLQEFLSKDKDIYPEGLITGYFGRLTEAAVKRWQAKYGIESIGIVGPKTRAKLKEVVAAAAPVVAAEIAPTVPQPVPVPAAPEPSQPATLPQDTAAPIIDNGSIKASSITSTAATVSWTTNESSDSIVRFTNDPSCSVVVDPSICVTNAASGNRDTVSHRVVVSGLITQALYYYAVSSSDVAGNKTTGSVQSFTTLSSTVSPILPDLKVESITITPSSPTVDQSATVSFRLSNPSRLAEVVNFVLAIIVGETEGAGDLVYKNLREDCPANLPALGSCIVEFDLIYKTPGKKTFYITVDPSGVINEDNNTNNTLAIAPFEVVPRPTDDTKSPEVTLSLSAPEATRVFVQYNSNEEALVVYEYGLTTGYGTIRTPWILYGVTNGAYIENLSPSTSYYVRAKATDRSGNIGYSQSYTFTTPTSTLKPIITSVPKFSAGAVSWNTNVACDGKVSYGLTADDYGNTTKDTNISNHQIMLSNLASGIAYRYRVSCVNDAGNVESVDYEFTTGRSTSTTMKSKLALILEPLVNVFRTIISWFW